MIGLASFRGSLNTASGTGYRYLFFIDTSNTDTYSCGPAGSYVPIYFLQHVSWSISPTGSSEVRQEYEMMQSDSTKFEFISATGYSTSGLATGKIGYSYQRVVIMTFNGLDQFTCSGSTLIKLPGNTAMPTSEVYNPMIGNLNRMFYGQSFNTNDPTKTATFVAGHPNKYAGSGAQNAIYAVNTKQFYKAQNLDIWYDAATNNLFYETYDATKVTSKNYNFGMIINTKPHPTGCEANCYIWSNDNPKTWNPVADFTQTALTFSSSSQNLLFSDQFFLVRYIINDVYVTSGNTWEGKVYLIYSNYIGLLPASCNLYEGTDGQNNCPTTSSFTGVTIQNLYIDQYGVLPKFQLGPMGFGQRYQTCMICNFNGQNMIPYGIKFYNCAYETLTVTFIDFIRTLNPSVTSVVTIKDYSLFFKITTPDTDVSRCAQTQNYKVFLDGTNTEYSGTWMYRDSSSGSLKGQNLSTFQNFKVYLKFYFQGGEVNSSSFLVLVSACQSSLQVISNAELSVSQVTQASMNVFKTRANYITETSGGNQCAPATACSIVDPANQPVDSTLIAVDSQTLDIKVETNRPFSIPQASLKCTTGFGQITSNVFQVNMVCPLTVSSLRQLEPIFAPFTLATTKQKIITGIEVASTTVQQASCKITYLLEEMVDNVASPYSGTWLDFDVNTGNVAVDVNTLGKKQLRIKISQPLAITWTSNVIDVEVKCGKETLIYGSVQDTFIFDQTNSSVPIDFSKLILSNHATCKPVKFNLNISMGTLYQGSDLTFDQQTGVLRMISSLNSYSETLLVEAITQSGIKFIQMIQVKKILKCGQEMLSAKEASELVFQFQYNNGASQISLSPTNLKDLFEISNHQNGICGIASFSIVMDTEGQAFPTDSETLKHLMISPDQEFKVLNNFPGQSTFNAYLMAETVGKVRAFKTISVVYKLEPPYSSDSIPKTMEMKSDTNFEYLSPSFKDKQNLPISFTFSGISLTCKCVQISSTGDSQVKLEVEASKLSQKDFGSYNINIQASNGVQNTNVYILFTIKEVEVVAASKATVSNTQVQEQTKPQVQSTKSEPTVQKTVETKSNPKIEQNVPQATQSNKETTSTIKNVVIVPEPNQEQIIIEEKSQDDDSDDSAATGNYGMVSISNDKGSSKQEKKAYLPIVLAIKSISKNGQVTIAFNQPLIVPEVILNHFNFTLRSLSHFEELVFEKDILNITYYSQTSENVDFTIKLLNWTSTQIDFLMNFTDPSMVSQGPKKDQVFISIVNKTYFKSLESGKLIQDANIQLAMAITKQLPKGVSQTEMEKTINTQQATVSSIVAVQICIQFFMKGAMKHLMSLFYTIQILSYLNIFDFSLPPNADMFLDMLQSLVEFQFLKPEPLIQLIYPEFTLEKFFNGAAQNNETQQSIAMDFIPWLTIFSIALLLVFTILASLCLCSCLPKLKVKVKAQALSIWQNFKFNGLIHSLLVAYIRMAISVAQQIDIVWHQPQNFNLTNFVIAMVLLVVLIAIILWFKRVLSQPISDLKSQLTLQKYSTLYDHLSLTRNNMARYYFIAFCLRRLSFAMLPVLLQQLKYLQVLFLLYWNLAYVLFYYSILCHKYKRDIILEGFNDLAITFAFYHLVSFTDFNLSQESQYFCGFSLQALIGLTAFVNISNMLWVSCSRIIRIRSIKRKKQKDLKSHLIEVKARASQHLKIKPKKHVTFQIDSSSSSSKTEESKSSSMENEVQPVQQHANYSTPNKMTTKELQTQQLYFPDTEIEPDSIMQLKYQLPLDSESEDHNNHEHLDFQEEQPQDDVEPTVEMLVEQLGNAVWYRVEYMQTQPFIPIPYEITGLIKFYHYDLCMKLQVGVYSPYTEVIDRCDALVKLIKQNFKNVFEFRDQILEFSLNGQIDDLNSFYEDKVQNA